MHLLVVDCKCNSNSLLVNMHILLVNCIRCTSNNNLLVNMHILLVNCTDVLLVMKSEVRKSNKFNINFKTQLPFFST